MPHVPQKHRADVNWFLFCAKLPRMDKTFWVHEASWAAYLQSNMNKGR